MNGFDFYFDLLRNGATMKTSNIRGNILLLIAFDEVERKPNFVA